MFHELRAVFKLKSAAVRGAPVLIWYPNDTISLVFSERVSSGNLVRYYDPRRERYMFVDPFARGYLGRIPIILVASGYIKSLSYGALGPLFAFRSDV